MPLTEVVLNLDDCSLKASREDPDGHVPCGDGGVNVPCGGVVPITSVEATCAQDEAGQGRLLFSQARVAEYEAAANPTEGERRLEMTIHWPGTNSLDSIIVRVPNDDAHTQEAIDYLQALLDRYHPN
jgi:hypothetical protein